MNFLIVISTLLTFYSTNNFSESKPSETVLFPFGEEIEMELTDSLLTPFEKSGGKQSATYQECIAYYKQLSSFSNEVKVLQYGTTSIGKPLNLVVVSKEGISKSSEVNRENKAVLLVNNAIHPGEPDGVDACMMLARDLVMKKEMKPLLEHVVLLIIPVYNISGALNRSCCSRANQDGPEESGFRGTIQNLDLNRDFIKNDAAESFSFENIFTEWKPDWFVDTHVSDGADYQYTMTYIATQHNKLQPLLADYEQKILVPYMNAEMIKKNFEMTPYVNELKETPDSGIVEFLESPKFSTGYASLFNCIGFVTETHMLKPFAQRVHSTYAFLNCWMQKANDDYKTIHQLHVKADDAVAHQQLFSMNFKPDFTSVTTILFKGYEAERKPSDVTGAPRLFYNRDKPYTKQIPFFNSFIPSVEIQKPVAYIIPQYSKKLISIFQNNGVLMQELSRDTLMKVEVYYITDYKSPDHPYESHYLHNSVTVKKDTQMIRMYAGDVMVKVNQPTNKFIVETMEPQSSDGFFAWNYFDGVLAQKEYFSDYVWEDKAFQLLQSDAQLKNLFEQEKKNNPDFVKTPAMQLDFIYKHSQYFENSYNRYPVVRMVNF